MFYDLEQDDRLAVKKAVALAVSRYNDTIGKFVQDKADRLTIVGDQLSRIARECAEVMKADEADVARLFDAYLADRTAEVAVSEPERVKVDEKGGTETENSDEVPQPEHGVRDDIKGTDAVLDDNPAEHIEMSDSSSIDRAYDPSTVISKTANPQPQTCPFCGHMMTPVQNAQNPAMSGQQQTCPNCGATVIATPPAAGQVQPGAGQPGFQQGMQTGIGGGMYAKCARCEKESAEEDSILCVACNHFVVEGKEASLEDTLAMLENQLAIAKRRKPRDVAGASATAPAEQVARLEAKIEKLKEQMEKEAADELEDPDAAMDGQAQSPAESDPTGTQAELPPAVKQDSNGPAQVYTGVVQQTANADAAMAWSTPGDEDIEKISQQFGLDPDEVRKNLRIVADFGDALAVNGDPNADPNVEGLTEVPGFGGSIPANEQEVDVDNAIQHTAEQTNLSPDDVYALVKESYGGDLGGQHYVSVQGEAHYYLPAEMVPQQQQQQPAQQDVDPQNETPQQAVQSSVPVHLQSIAAFLEWEKGQLAHSAA